MSNIPRFTPSADGLHFANYWPAGTPDYTIKIDPLGSVSIGDASNGLCGGMVFTVADLYIAGRKPPAQTEPPEASSGLFKYIANRLLSSFNIPAGILTYYYWAITPDHDTGLWPVIREGLASMTIRHQLPQITGSIDNGYPAALGLVTVRSLNPGDLGHCHQVLAYGYEWSGTRISIAVYDPNQPDNDAVTITLDTSNPAHTTTIDSNVACDPIRGFFYTNYAFADPSLIAAH